MERSSISSLSYVKSTLTSTNAVAEVREERKKRLGESVRQKSMWKVRVISCAVTLTSRALVKISTWKERECSRLELIGLTRNAGNVTFIQLDSQL